MRAINHAFTGAIIGFTIDEPVIAYPLAFVSHYVLDALPHFGERKDSRTSFTFNVLLIADVVVCVGFVVLLSILRPKRWLEAAICAFLATSPDFMWFGNYVRQLKHKKEKPYHNPAVLLHIKIQWYQLPLGAITEVIWLIACVIVLRKLV